MWCDVIWGTNYVLAGREAYLRTDAMQANEGNAQPPEEVLKAEARRIMTRVSGMPRERLRRIVLHVLAHDNTLKKSVELKLRIADEVEAARLTDVRDSLGQPVLDGDKAFDDLEKEHKTEEREDRQEDRLMEAEGATELEARPQPNPTPTPTAARRRPLTRCCTVLGHVSSYCSSSSCSCSEA